MTESGPIIRTEKLCRKFGEAFAVRDLDLKVKRGEVFGLVGPDGAGKTTTMRLLSGILEPTSGTAWVDGIPVRDYPEKIKEAIAYMPQRFGLYQDMSVMENLIFYADLFLVPKRLRPERIEKLFGFSRLGPFKDRPAGALSGGMKQKLALACALIHSPRLLLLDEPTNGVDPVSRRDFWKILYDLVRDGMSILVSTAYLDEAERVHRVGLMSLGSLVHCGTPQQIKNLVRGVIVELITSDVRRSKICLADMPEVLEVNAFGEGLHVRFAGELNSEAMRQTLESSGIKIHSMKQISPSIEDAFLSLIPRDEVA